MDHGGHRAAAVHVHQVRCRVGAGPSGTALQAAGEWVGAQVVLCLQETHVLGSD